VQAFLILKHSSNGFLKFKQWIPSHGMQYFYAQINTESFQPAFVNIDYFAVSIDVSPTSSAKHTVSTSKKIR